jgi:hypothetical protein
MKPFLVKFLQQARDKTLLGKPISTQAFQSKLLHGALTKCAVLACVL